MGVVVGAALVGAVLPAPAIGSRARSIPDVQQLYGSATRHVRHSNKGLLAKAVLYEADGSTADGHGVSSAAGMTRWRFVFDNPTPKSRYASATIAYGPRPKGYGRVTAYKAPFLEDYEITRAPKISLRTAVASLRRAGHSGLFNGVTLRDPIAPPFDGALYIFTFVASGKVTYLAVSATTGKVEKPQ
jgi:hypothetical protein